jgi:drug/metabolite transporter (DMT)-like permease
MAPTVMLIVLLAALLHASWNFIVKRTDDKHLSMSAVVIGHAPFAVAALVVAPLPRPEAYPFLIAGTALHVGYQLSLLASYRIGDLSQVYPLARGVAPLLVTGIAITLMGVHLSRIERIAVAAIAVGIMSLTVVRRSDGNRNAKAALSALITGGFIAAYSLVDGLGARAAGTALGYYGWLSTVNAIIFAVLMRFVQPGVVKRLVFRDWRLALGAGGASFSAYAMVTWAFTVAPIPLVTALRETSIIFALLLGVLVLKERLDLMKVFATAFTIVGVGLLRINR